MTKEQLDRLYAADESGHFAHVREMCREILDVSPEDWITLLFYADALTASARYDAAAEALSRAMEVVPENLLHQVYAKQGHLLEAQGKFIEAEHQFLKAHEVHPDLASPLIYASSMAFGRGEIAIGEKYARAATECSEGALEEAWFHLGKSLAAQRRYREASACFEMALEIDPDYESAKVRVADMREVLALE